MASETVTNKTNMADAWAWYDDRQVHMPDATLRALMFQLQNALPYLKARRLRHPEAYVDALEARDWLLRLSDERQEDPATELIEKQLLHSAAEQLRAVPV